MSERPAIPALAAAGVAGLAAWAASGALAHDRPARLGQFAATGEVRLVSPSAGTAVLDANRLVPGQSTGGTVRLANTGDAPGMVELDATGVLDTLGLGGGRLSNVLVVEVDDVTAATPALLYRGPISGLAAARLGRLDAGAGRTFRVTATLPDSGPFGADNSLQGAATRLDLTWHAERLAPAVTPTPTPTPTPVRTPAPSATPAPVVTPVPIQQNAAASVLTLRIPWQRVMMTRGITMTAGCDRRCRLTFTALVRTAPPGGAGRVLLRGKVFRMTGRHRVLRPGGQRRIRLRLTPGAVRRMHAALLVRGRVAVQVNARVRSSLGAATVHRRIVIVTTRRAERHRAQGLSRGSARRP